MARKGALIPRTSSSLIPANPGRQILSSFFHNSRFNISWRIWISATPESISLWPAISFIHFFLLNWKKRFLNPTLEFISNHKPVRRSCVRLNARRSRDRLGNCSVISCQTPAYVFLNQDVWIFLPAPGYVFLNERDRVSSWYSWAATWVETLYEAVVRPLVADIEGCRNWAPVRILPTWMEDFLRCTKVKHFTKNVDQLKVYLFLGSVALSVISWLYVRCCTLLFSHRKKNGWRNKAFLWMGRLYLANNKDISNKN